MPDLSAFMLRDPWFLALGFAGLVLMIAGQIARRAGRDAVPFAPAAFVGPGARRSWRSRLLWVPRGMQVAGLLCAVVALARPVERVALPLRAEGIDLVLCLDVSSSMAARDMDPDKSRLVLAKAAATEFAEQRPTDRIGIVAFARYADVLCPPTLDHSALGGIVAEVELVEADGPEDRTGIGGAVARAAQVLRRSEARSKVIVLLTDGEENVATGGSTRGEIAPKQAGQVCETLGVRVYTIAIGIGRRARGGDWTALDTTAVEELAASTGGAFFAARDADAVSGVFAAIDSLEKSEFEEPRYEDRERFLPFLWVAGALLILGRLLGVTLWEVVP